MIDSAMSLGPSVIAFVSGLIVGLAVPSYYGLERLAGFGRAAMDQLPYKPPPGKSEEEALREAAEPEE